MVRSEIALILANQNPTILRRDIDKNNLRYII